MYDINTLQENDNDDEDALQYPSYHLIVRENRLKVEEREVIALQPSVKRFADTLRVIIQVFWKFFKLPDNRRMRERALLTAHKMQLEEAAKVSKVWMPVTNVFF